MCADHTGRWLRADSPEAAELSVYNPFQLEFFLGRVWSKKSRFVSPDRFEEYEHYPAPV